MVIRIDAKMAARVRVGAAIVINDVPGDARRKRCRTGYVAADKSQEIVEWDAVSLDDAIATIAEQVHDNPQLGALYVVYDNGRGIMDAEEGG